MAAAAAAQLQLPGTPEPVLSPAALHLQSGTPNNTTLRPESAPSQASGINSGGMHETAASTVPPSSHTSVGRGGGIGRGGGSGGGIGRGATSSTVGSPFTQSTQPHSRPPAQQALQPIAGDPQPAARPLSALPPKQQQAPSKQQAPGRPQVAVSTASHHWNPWDPTTFGQFGRDIEGGDINHGLRGSQGTITGGAGTRQPQLQRAATAGGSKKQHRTAEAEAEPQRPHTASGLLSKFFRWCSIVSVTRPKHS